MTRNKIQCNYCGKIRSENTTFAGLCDACAKKLQTGIITAEQIEKRKMMIRRQEPAAPIYRPADPLSADMAGEYGLEAPIAHAAPVLTSDPVPTFTNPIPTQPDPVPMFTEPIPTQPDPVPTEPTPTASADGDGIRYFCDVCNAELRRGEYECPKCHVVNDWRGTDVETDPDIVICDRCGAITDGKTCRRCGA